MFTGRVPLTPTMLQRCDWCGAEPGAPCRCPSTGRITELMAHPSRADKAGIPKLRRRLKSLREVR